MIREHQLWVEVDEMGRTVSQTFCFAGPEGDQARSMLAAEAKLIWTVEAESYNEAMTKYYQHMDWGQYKPAFEEECDPYSDQ
jgi:hypothetical protein